MTLITYGLLKPEVGGPAEQTQPAQGCSLLEYHVLCKAPSIATASHPKLRTHLATFCLTSAAQSSITYPPYPSFQTEQVWRKPEIGLPYPPKTAEDVKRWYVLVIRVSLPRASSSRRLVARQKHKGVYNNVPKRSL